ncbi:hypothetical protein ACFLV7_09770 [Chloroflexota bacterium]
MPPFLKRLIAALGLLAVVMVGYLFVARPYQLNWGATEQEISAPMPGDEFDTAPDFFATRAITIQDTPQEIWPWLIQMGYNRAGFYGYDVLENLGSERGLHSLEHILPEFQNFQVGDVIPISAVVAMEFYAIEPGQYLIWSGSDGTDSFLWSLQPVDATHTRLISRIRWSYDWTQPQSLGLDLFTEFTDHIAVHKILMGVKGRVEGSIEPMAQQNVEFTLFVISAFVFFASLILLLVRPLNGSRWLAGLGAGLVWLITWYAPIALLLSIVITVLAILALYGVHRKRERAVTHPKKYSKEKTS